MQCPRCERTDKFSQIKRSVLEFLFTFWSKDRRRFECGICECRFWADLSHEQDLPKSAPVDSEMKEVGNNPTSNFTQRLRIR